MPSNTSRKKKKLCPECSDMANRIAEKILEEFKLTYRKQAMNYWGLSSAIPKLLAERVNNVLVGEVKNDDIEDATEQYDE